MVVRLIIVRLTMRSSDAGLHRPKSKLIYANHRLPPWLTENATPRALEPIVRPDGELPELVAHRNLHGVSSFSQNFDVYLSSRSSPSRN